MSANPQRDWRREACAGLAYATRDLEHANLFGGHWTRVRALEAAVEAAERDLAGAGGKVEGGRPT